MGDRSLAKATTKSPIVARGKQCLLALERLQAKKAIIGQLIDGRLHLMDAAARFHDLARSANASGAVAGAQDNDEYWCRAVIGWVCLALSERPERADVLAGQLEAELASYLERKTAIN
jgi:hypothetical protein